MGKLTTIILFALFSVVTGAADLRAEDQSAFRIGGDLFAAGRSVTLNTAETDDLFAAGDSVRIAAPVSGTAHMVGRSLDVDAPVGLNLYAAGLSVKVAAPVDGNASLAGYSVVVAAPVGGDLRATGTTVEVSDSVAGYAMMAGETVRLNAVVGGDVAIAGDTIAFGEAARVAGILTINADNADAVEVPDWVAPAERIRRQALPEFDHPPTGERGERAIVERHGPRAMGFAISVAILALAVFVVAALAPESLARAGEEILDRPGRMVWIGLLGLSVPIGAAFLMVLTLIGIITVPVLLPLAGLFAMAGGLVATWAIGVMVLTSMGRMEPESLGERLVSAIAGALVVKLLMLVPFVGWLIGFGIVLAGCGGIVERAVRPRFFGDDLG